MKRLFTGVLILLSTNAVYADGLWPPETTKTPTEQASVSDTAPKVEARLEETNQAQLLLTDRQFEKLITITKQVEPLNSKLNKMYSAYKVTIISDFTNTLSVKHANVNNGVIGNAAASSVRKSPWRGLGWALIPYVGIIAGPAVAIKNGVKNSNAEKEAAVFTGQIPSQELKRGEPLQFHTLVPIGQMPIMTIKFIDKEADHEYVMNGV